MSCDRHVLSGVRELSIMLSYVGAPPKNGYYNHKCSRWIRASRENFQWAIKHALALCAEYTFRYGKVHANQQIIERIASEKHEFENTFITPFALAVPEEIIPHSTGAVDTYRQYYLAYKQHLLSYTRREIPEWIQEAGLGTWKEAKCSVG